MEPVKRHRGVLAHLGLLRLSSTRSTRTARRSRAGRVTNDLCTPCARRHRRRFPRGCDPARTRVLNNRPIPSPRHDVTQSVAAALKVHGPINPWRPRSKVVTRWWLGVRRAGEAGSIAQEVTEAKTVVDGIVFRSASNAAVKFHSDLGPDGTSGPYFADAALTAGGWQVTRASYCQIIIAAGAHCP